MVDIVSEFISRYQKEFDYYENLSNEVESILKGIFFDVGIRAMVSSRAKDIKRLKDKINQRCSVKDYKTVDDIYGDIVDLAGVRVALYFPGDAKKVGDIIKNEFDLIEKPSFFPKKKDDSDDDNKTSDVKYVKVFSGYSASHFRVKLKGDGRYSDNGNVEIQVASVLMHAWSEVEHDLVYKPLQGELSEEEYLILDEINGLVLSGNLALQRLQSAGERRIAENGYEFKNHYDVANYFVRELGISDALNYSTVFSFMKSINKIKGIDFKKVAQKYEEISSSDSSLSPNGLDSKKDHKLIENNLYSALFSTYTDDFIKYLRKLKGKNKTKHDKNEYEYILRRVMIALGINTSFIHVIDPLVVLYEHMESINNTSGFKFAMSSLYDIKVPDEQESIFIELLKDAKEKREIMLGEHVTEAHIRAYMEALRKINDITITP